MILERRGESFAAYMTASLDCEGRASRWTASVPGSSAGCGRAPVSAADLTAGAPGWRRSGSAIGGKMCSAASRRGAQSMTVRRVAIPLAALPLALVLGCERQPGLQIATDRAARDAGADGGSDRGASRATRRAAIGQGRTRPAATRPPRCDARGRRYASADAAPADASALDAARADGGGGDGGFELLGAPLVFAPTPRGFGLSVVLRSGDPTALALRVRDEELSAWSVLGPPLSPAVDIAQWTVDGLAPGRRYVYEVSAPGAAGEVGSGLAGSAARSSLYGERRHGPGAGDSVHLRPHHRHAHRAARSGSAGRHRHRRLLRDDGDHAARRHG